MLLQLKKMGCIPLLAIEEGFRELANGKSAKWPFYAGFVVDSKGADLNKAFLAALNKAVRNV